MLSLTCLLRNLSVLFVVMMIGIGRPSSTDRNVCATGTVRSYLTVGFLSLMSRPRSARFSCSQRTQCSGFSVLLSAHAGSGRSIVRAPPSADGSGVFLGRRASPRVATTLHRLAGTLALQGAVPMQRFTHHVVAATSIPNFQFPVSSFQFPVFRLRRISRP